MPEDQIKCYHCGEDCGPEPVMHDDKPFCCYGCKAVYEILSESKACDYYSLDQHPGIRVNTVEIGNKYAYLDNDEIKKEIIEFSDGGWGLNILAQNQKCWSPQEQK
jgi:Cu+-exporting ATPase